MRKTKRIQLRYYYPEHPDWIVAMLTKARRIRLRLFKLLEHCEDFKGFWTFTFYDDIPNERRAHLWNKFMARLRKRFKYLKIRYVRVKEFTRKGKIHYHVLFNAWLPWSIVQDIWKDIEAGVVVDVQPITNRMYAACYLGKYLVKSLLNMGKKTLDTRGVLTFSFCFCVHLSNFPKWLNKALRLGAFGYLNAVVKLFDFSVYLFHLGISKRKWCEMMRFIQSWYDRTGDWLANHKRLNLKPDAEPISTHQ